MPIDYQKLRETTGLDEVAFAKEVGVTPELVIAWETHIIEPTVKERKNVFAVVKKYAERGQ